MIAFLLRMRYIAVAVVLLFLIHSVGLIGIGAFRAYEAYRHLPSTIDSPEATRPAIRIAQSVDSLFFGLMLFVLSLGTASLFLRDSRDEADPRLPNWVKVPNLSALKMLLWEAILITLVVETLVTFITDVDNLRWQLLILPAAILVLSVGLYLMRKTEH